MIETISDNSLVRRGAGGDGALRATVARVGGADDLDIIWVGLSVALGRGESSHEGSEEEELGKHLDFGLLVRMKSR